MQTPDLFYIEFGLGCRWIEGPCADLYPFPALYMMDGWVVLWLLIALIGVLTCVRWGAFLLWSLVRPSYRSPEERVVTEFRRRAQRASIDYLDPYR